MYKGTSVGDISCVVVRECESLYNYACLPLDRYKVSTEYIPICDRNKYSKS